MGSQKNYPKKLLFPVLLILAGAVLLMNQSIVGLFSKSKIDVKIEHIPFIMPAAYKVYANPEALDGKYGLFKMLLTNNGSTTIKNMEVYFEIQDYIEDTRLEKIPILLPGQSFVVNCFPKFNQDIVEKTTASREKVHIRIEGQNIEEIEESFNIDIKGRNEFLYTQIPTSEIAGYQDIFDNDVLLSCFITPEDPIVKYYTQQIQEKVLKGEKAVVVNTPEESARVLMGIYQATVNSHMVYSGTGGIPTNESDYQSISQNLRLPREVVTGNTGLCIELSLLYASIMLQMGMDPVIYMIPGHAYPGFHLNGSYYGLEATLIGGEGLGSIGTSEEAMEHGMKQVEEFMQMAQMGDPRYSILHIEKLIKDGAVAMELKDDSFLRQKVDDIAKSFTQTGQNETYYAQNPQGGQAGGGGDGGGAVASGKQYRGEVTFSYPSHWSQFPDNSQNPYMIAIFGNQSTGANVQIYSIRGASSADQAMMAIKQSIEAYGYQVSYSTAGQSNGFTVYQGQTNGPYGYISWSGAFKRTSGGVAGITVDMGSGSQNDVTMIYNSLQ